MKAIIFRVFDRFANSPTNYRFFDTCLMLLKLRKMGRKLKQSLEVPILTPELYVFTRAYGKHGNLEPDPEPEPEPEPEPDPETEPEK